MESSDKKNVLIIEDNVAFLKIMKMRLEAAGYRVKTAQEGLEGFSLAQKGGFDLIILDLMLPGMDGHRICRLLKFDKKFRHIPVIILTSRDLDEDARLARQCGADAFIVKTTKFEVVLDVIERLLKKRESTECIAEPM